MSEAIDKTINVASGLLKKSKKTSAQLKKRFDAYTNAFTNSEFFKNKCKEVFQSVDMDKSGTVDAKELYAAVLLVYLQLAKIVRGLTPPTHEDVAALMKKVDIDGDDGLTLEEFTELTSLLVGNIVVRVAAQVLLTFLAAPLIAAILIYILCFFSPPHKFWGYIVPPGVPTSIMSAILTMIVVPKVLDMVDDHFAKDKSHNQQENPKDLDQRVEAKKDE